MVEKRITERYHRLYKKSKVIKESYKSKHDNILYLLKNKKYKKKEHLNQYFRKTLSVSWHWRMD